MIYVIATTTKTCHYTLNLKLNQTIEKTKESKLLKFWQLFMDQINPKKNKIQDNIQSFLCTNTS
jgi:transposase-like protein